MLVDCKNSASTELQSGSTLINSKYLNANQAHSSVETVQYFRRLARTPIVEASREKGMLLFLHDLDQPEKIDFLHDAVAHTPYARAHKLQGFKHIQGASWTVYFSKDPSVEKMAMVAPAYTPKSSYIANAVVPSFARSVTTDATFVADIGMFPYRKSFIVATMKSTMAL